MGSIHKWLSCLMLVCTLSSCHTSQKVLYLQDAVINTPEEIVKGHDITLQPKDQISIMVKSKDQQISDLFNLSAGGSSSTQSMGGNKVLGYTLDNEGNIDFPILGTIHLQGMTKEEVTSYIKKTLIDKKLVNDPIVTVEFGNLYFSMLGEVNSPGQYSITKDQVTLLDAIGMAGDLTITGKRDNIYVIREENGKRTTYQVDIRSKELFNSPVYYLKQNDVVYVQPNSMRAGQSNVNENSLKSVSMWMSLVSFFISIGVLVFK